MTMEWVHKAVALRPGRELSVAMYTRIGDEVWAVHEGRLLFAGTVRPWLGRIHISKWLACYPEQADEDGDQFTREESGIRLLLDRCLYLANKVGLSSTTPNPLPDPVARRLPDPVARRLPPRGPRREAFRKT